VRESHGGITTLKPLFDPRPEQEFYLRIDEQERRFRVIEHPKAPGFAHAMEGSEAKVYRVKGLEAGSHEYALKIMKFRHQDRDFEQTCNELNRLKTIPGLRVCERRCLSPSGEGESIGRYRDLRYAILMPWIHGLSWFDILVLGKEGQSTLDKYRAFRLAYNLAAILSNLEAAGIAHCNLSAGNVIIDVDPNRLQIELIGVEDIYVRGFHQPRCKTLGKPGYQHRTDTQGQWHAQGDRFAGAILLCEMLGWYDDKVRAISYGETYFKPDELQSDRSQRLEVLTEAVSRHDNDLVEMLRRVWESTTLDECPSLNEWNQILNWVKLKKYVEFGEPIGPAIGLPSSPIRDLLTNEPADARGGEPATELVEWEPLKWEPPKRTGDVVVWEQPE
jgi:serine/threonine protein kinase